MKLFKEQFHARKCVLSQVFIDWALQEMIAALILRLKDAKEPLKESWSFGLRFQIPTE